MGYDPGKAAPWPPTYYKHVTSNLEEVEEDVEYDMDDEVRDMEYVRFLACAYMHDIA